MTSLLCVLSQVGMWSSCRCVCFTGRYNGAISELAIHSACSGALQILSSSGSSKNQVSQLALLDWTS